jgi:16S rRNA (cytosine967-C5)-methyltransferase
MKSNKWLGSKDRHAIREFMYSYHRYRPVIEHVSDDLIGESVDSSVYLKNAYLSIAIAKEGIVDTPPYYDPRFDGYILRYIDEGNEDLSSALSHLKSIDKESIRKILVDSIPEVWNKNLKGMDDSGKLKLFTRASTDLRPNYLNVSESGVENIIEGLRKTIPKEYYQEPMLVNDSIKICADLKLQDIEYYQNGSLEVMDEGSRMIVKFLDPHPGMSILDACAGAGGKSLEIQSITKNGALVDAFDLNEFRIRELVRRSAIAGAEIRLWDGSTSDYDCVLIDAPCTGSGRIRRQPELFNTVTREMLAELTSKQYDIISDYSKHVSIGGYLVYATCSIFSEENEDVINKFLSENTDFEIAQYDGKAYSGLADGILDNEKKFMKILPGKLNTDGFFAAKLKRIS